MRARTVQAHRAMRIRAEQEWFTENQDVIRASLRIGVDLPTMRQRSPGKLEFRAQDLRQETPLPSQMLVKRLMHAAITTNRERPKPQLGPTLQRAIDIAAPILHAPELNLSWGSTHMDVCSVAEPAFAAAVRQALGKRLTRRSQPAVRHHRLSVYYDESGTPLLFRKRALSETAMLLRTVEVSDDALGAITLPPGTIVSPFRSLHDKTPISTETARTAIESGVEIRTYQIDPSTFGITPLRLSPWAYTEDVDRALFSLETPRIGGERADFQHHRWKSYKDIRLEHFHEAASRIMELCGVTTAQPTPGSELVAS